MTTGRHLSGLSANPSAELVNLAPIIKHSRYLTAFEIGVLTRVLDTTASRFPLGVSRRSAIRELLASAAADGNRGIGIVQVHLSPLERDDMSSA